MSSAGPHRADIELGKMRPGNRGLADGDEKSSGGRSEESGIAMGDSIKPGVAATTSEGHEPTPSIRSLESAEKPEPKRQNQPPGPLRTFDIFALIVNKMIGTGIFGNPISVLLLAGNKKFALGLWLIGFVYTVVSMFIYLDYAATLPYTGGELVYLDEITASSGKNTPPPTNFSVLSRWKRWRYKILGDGLLAYVVYAFLFVGLFNSGTNSMQVGRQVLIFTQAVGKGAAGQPPNGDLLRFIGIFTLSLLCLIQYFSAQWGRSLNKWFAVIKIIFLLILIGAGGVTAKQNHQVSGWSEWHPSDSKSKWAYAKALLLVLFSFEGWENATFVAGEIPTRSQHILVVGFISAVSVVGTLYLCLTAVVLEALKWETILENPTNNNYAPMFFNNARHAQGAWAILTAISALGSLNSIIYTFSRVKQAIGDSNILPLSRIWRKDDRVHRGENSDLHKSPQGGLILHWIMSVVVICGSASVHSTLESVNLPGYLQTYSHCFILLILGAAFPCLRSRERSLEQEVNIRAPRLSSATSTPAWLAVQITVLIYCLTNLFLLIANAVPPYASADANHAPFPGKYFPAITFSIAGMGMAYYFLIFGAAPRIYPSLLSFELEGQPQITCRGLWGKATLPANHAAKRIGSGSNPVSDSAGSAISRFGSFGLLGLVHVRCEIRKDFVYDPDRERVHRFGRRWRIRYLLEEKYQDETYVNFLYWLFGGHLSRSPVARARMKLRSFKKRLKNWPKGLVRSGRGKENSPGDVLTGVSSNGKGS